MIENNEKLSWSKKHGDKLKWRGKMVSLSFELPSLHPSRGNWKMWAKAGHPKLIIHITSKVQ